MSTTEPAIPATLGQSIPPDTPHAVSVSLPTWKSNVGYEEGKSWVVSRMVTGYPRFYIHKIIQALATLIVRKYATPDDGCLLLHSHGAALRCAEFLQSCKPCAQSDVRILDFAPGGSDPDSKDRPKPIIFAVIHPLDCAKLAKSFWQHTGEGVTSRRAEYCRRLFDEGLLVESGHASLPLKLSKGPRRYKKDLSYDDEPPPDAVQNGSTAGGLENGDRARFLEERFGRNLGIEMSERAKIAVRRRISGSLTADTDIDEALETSKDNREMRDVANFSVSDVYLYPGGMNSIFSTHRMIMLARGADCRKSICFGFPYIDTLKVLEKFGPGALFYGNGSDDDLDDLEKRLASGERYNALYCEFPSNPLLKCPNLDRIYALSRKHDFAVVVDETVGNFLNIHVLPFADVVVSSLTKIFSGDSNVMGGSAVLNPQSQYYSLFKQTWSEHYEDVMWPEDVIFLERNSRDFVQRIARINSNAEAACNALLGHPKIKDLYYPRVNPSKKYYDARKTPTGGYGGLLSATFHNEADAAAFFDDLNFDKGPSLGTNFTLASPFVILAHFTELEWAESFGVDRNLVRFSIGLEETGDLVNKLKHALAAIPL
ncbi:hypothetical protein FH972_022566 [Carpinus fangiana]|uniref:Cystathionine gamma-synthase n=1 Tax=Carpinus fangiana TaxID=176857 RepID=A0A5N6KT65_9ROSI|nr:hypothetical protein FH972_022566 [Carpinus fangiana]